MPAARDQVMAGIQAGTLDDARDVITRLAGQMLPVCPTVDADHADQSQVLPPRPPVRRAPVRHRPPGSAPCTGTAGADAVPPTPPAVPQRLHPVSTEPGSAGSAPARRCPAPG